ncbi:signal recognition particle-docking protein FtsY [Chromatium okenii]|uniref:signal recognition particle-docking protein FtsY n=1 Tax=Chromatium okenii TaxID=61644 RepID=UPI0026EED836|nr:signal recognition particle-docking protein FtsY [Chromatium okenii]MBV5311079.1 signal recognition particle-docking protein FtsY [Chromatium okenii]
MFGFGKKHKTPAPPLPDVGADAPKAPGLFSKLFKSTPEADAPPAAPAPAPVAPPPVVAPAAESDAAPGLFSKFFKSNKIDAEIALVAAPEPEPEDELKRGVLSRLRERLARSRSNLGDGLGTLFLGRKRIDDELMEELETLLITADVGVTATARIIADLTERVKRKTLADPPALLLALKADLRNLLLAAEQPVRQPALGKPQVILMVGVNGAGKTTTIGKLAKRLQAEGNSVMLAAGDTFRAAAVEQLEAWGERNQIPVIAQHTGADSASVIFDALQAATARGVDVLIADTAGRLHTKTNLMDELSKVARVLKKIDPEAPHEVMLVVDATTGQNAINQAEHFHRAVGLTGITLTKLDGTAKGGILFAIAERLQLPIRFIGVGESIDDLRPFDADEFVNALLG